MKYQKVPVPEENQIYSIPLCPPAAYKPGLSHSSQRSFFRYSAIETDLVSYEPGRDTVCPEYAFPGHSGLPEENDLTMKDPDAYLKCTGKYSKSSGILKSGKQ